MWDLNSDRYVDFEEYTEKTFEIWDADNNGYIDAEEYSISYYDENTDYDENTEN